LRNDGAIVSVSRKKGGVKKGVREDRHHPRLSCGGESLRSISYQQKRGEREKKKGRASLLYPAWTAVVRRQDTLRQIGWEGRRWRRSRASVHEKREKRGRKGGYGKLPSAILLLMLKELLLQARYLLTAREEKERGRFSRASFPLLLGSDEILIPSSFSVEEKKRERKKEKKTKKSTAFQE